MAIRHDDHPTERVERIHDEPAPGYRSAQQVNVSGTAVSSPVWSVTSVVTLIFGVLEVLLLLRFVFKLARANPNQPLVQALYGVTEPLARPFQGIFPQPPEPVLIDIPALLAILFLFLIGALVVALVRAITAPRAY